MAYRLSDDKYLALMAQFYSQLKRKLKHYRPRSRYQSFVIDSGKGLLYSYDGRCANHGVGTMITLDLNDSNKMLGETHIYPVKDFSFEYRMRVVKHQIHFVMGFSTPQHWIYSPEKEEFRLLQKMDPEKEQNRNGGVIYSQRHSTIF